MILLVILLIFTHLAAFLLGVWLTIGRYERQVTDGEYWVYIDRPKKGRRAGKTARGH